MNRIVIDPRLPSELDAALATAIGAGDLMLIQKAGEALMRPIAASVLGKRVISIEATSVEPASISGTWNSVVAAQITDVVADDLILVYADIVAYAYRNAGTAGAFGAQAKLVRNGSDVTSAQYAVMHNQASYVGGAWGSAGNKSFFRVDTGMIGTITYGVSARYSDLAVSGQASGRVQLMRFGA